MSKRDEIAQRVLGKLAEQEPAPASPPRPRVMNTFIGQVGAQMTQGFAARVEELERERAEGRVVLRLDPKTVRFSQLANRHELSLKASDADFRALKDDLRQNGQEFPIKVKAIEGDATHEFEVVAGHRRLQACRELDTERPGGFPVFAVLDGTAAELRAHALKMYRENALRKDLSPYETGTMFRRWLAEGLFATQKELAETLGLSTPTVSHYLAVADLPAEILRAFRDPRAISLRWVNELGPALKSHGKAVLEAAGRLARMNPAPEPEAVLRELLAAAKGRGRRAVRPEAETVKIGGKSLYTISWKGSRVALKFGKQVDAATVGEAQDAVKAFLTQWLKKRVR
jgi:ParB family chromosome partitioning protein